MFCIMSILVHNMLDECVGIAAIQIRYHCGHCAYQCCADIVSSKFERGFRKQPDILIPGCVSWCQKYRWNVQRYIGDTIWVEYYTPYTSWYPHNFDMCQCCVDISFIIYKSVRVLKEYQEFNTWWIIVLKCLFIKCPSIYRLFHGFAMVYVLRAIIKWVWILLLTAVMSSGRVFNARHCTFIDTCTTLELPFINQWVRVLKENQEFDTQQTVASKILMKCPRVYNWYHGILWQFMCKWVSLLIFDGCDTIRVGYFMYISLIPR